MFASPFQNYGNIGQPLGGLNPGMQAGPAQIGIGQQPGQLGGPNVRAMTAGLQNGAGGAIPHTTPVQQPPPSPMGGGSDSSSLLGMMLQNAKNQNKPVDINSSPAAMNSTALTSQLVQPGQEYTNPIGPRTVDGSPMPSTPITPDQEYTNPIGPSQPSGGGGSGGGMGSWFSNLFSGG
jgi:hypothetical protein